MVIQSERKGRKFKIFLFSDSFQYYLLKIKNKSPQHDFFFLVLVFLFVCCTLLQRCRTLFHPMPADSGTKAEHRDVVQQPTVDEAGKTCLDVVRIRGRRKLGTPASQLSLYTVNV